MTRTQAPLGLSLRVLAAPGFVLALVVLALNDQVLKQAWPGWVTGKLSDVAGLVVAPLLLAVPLTAVRLARPVPWAIALTGIGFALTKSSAAGAAITSDLWSVSGVPTMMRADATDLLALPALYVAWWVHRSVRDRPAERWRRVLALAVGTAVLPCGVLATAATSCVPPDGLDQVLLVEGRFPGPPAGVEQRLMVGASYDDYPDISIDAAGRLATVQVGVLAGIDRARQDCDAAVPTRCWRAAAEGVRIEATDDGGLTWRPELELTDADIERIADEVGDQCGDAAVVRASDLGVVSEGGEPVVAVALDDGGLALRRDGAWERLTVEEISRTSADQRPSPPAPPTVTPVGTPRPTATPSPSDGPPTPRCPRPSQVTVTPDPRNGPPTSYEVC